MKTVFVIGEVLCDLFCPRPGLEADGAAHLVPHAGGGPANCAAQLARLQVPVALVTAIGDDPLGARVVRALAAEGVDTSSVFPRLRTRTGITLVEVDSEGERRFTPWREGSADLSLRRDELPEQALKKAAALVHGTVSLRADPARAATRRAVALVRRAGGLIAVDVNLRPQMYANPETMLRRAREASERAHVVKATVEEARALVGGRGPNAVAARLIASGAVLVALTDGPRDAWLGCGRRVVHVTPPRVQVRDATGAGDAFLGALIADLARLGTTPSDLAALDEAMLTRLATRAAAAGSRVTTKVGATTAMLRRLPGAAPRR